MSKCKGGCQMRAGGKTCAKCGCDMEDEDYEKGEKGEKEMRSGGMACMKCGGKMHKSGGTVSSCMKCGGGKYTFGGKVGWSKKKINDTYASGGMIKRADGSYSQRGLWDNIRANAGSGKKPTKQMLEQEKKIKQEMAVGGMVDSKCPPGMIWDESKKTCVSVWVYDNYGNKQEDFRPWMMNEIPENRKENPIKYYVEGDPVGIKASQMYSDSLVKYNQSIKDIQNFNNKSLPTYTPIKKGGYMDMFYKNTGQITPSGQFKSPKSQCSNDGVCIDIYPKPVQPIDFYRMKKSITPIMDEKQTLGYKISEMTNTGNTYNDRKNLAKQYDFEKLTGRPYKGTIPDNEYLYNTILKQKEDTKQYEKRREENPILEPEPRIDNEPEIKLYPEPINLSIIKPSFISTNNNNNKVESEQGAYNTYISNASESIGNESPYRKVYAGPGANTGRVKPVIPMPNQMWETGPGKERSLQEQHADDPSVIVNPKEFIENRKKLYENKKYKSGGMADTGCPDGFVKDPRTGECIQKEMIAYNDSTSLYNRGLKHYSDRKNDIGGLEPRSYEYKNDYEKIQGFNNLYDFVKNEINNTYNQGTQLKDYYTNTGIWETLNMSKNKNILPTIMIGNEAIYAPYFKKPTKPAVRVPEMLVEETTKMMDDFEKDRKQKKLETIAQKALQDINPGKPKQEPDIYSSRKMIKYSPEDAKILYELQGMGPMEGTMGSSAYENDLDLKLKMYKSGSKFAPIMQQVGGYNNIPRHDFGPTEEDVRRFREEPGYRQQWDKDILMQYYGMKPEDFQATNKRKQYSFGGVITGLKKYGPGGEIDSTLMTNDTEIALGKGMFNVPEPQYDANKIMANVFKNAVSLKETEQPTTKEPSDYKKIVQSNKITKDNKALPNWGRAQKEQQILNELIRRDISQGIQTVPLLVEDDIIGDKTLEAMRLYEKSGKYSRPELFKDKWLAEYKKQWEDIQRGKQSSNQQQTQTEVGQTQTESVNPSYNPNLNPIPSFNYFSSDWGKLSSDTKANTSTSTSTSKPKPQGKGWPKQELLKEGGIEIDAKELVPKDFDTYKPIRGISKSTKGVRATGRDKSKAYFDAVEKGQYFDLNGLKANTSLKLIGDLLSKSKKVIVIPKGQDEYGRDLNDIYLQDENNSNQYHALDSFGVVNREAIFGKYKDSGEENMTDRQKLITKQAKEAGGFKYNMSPWLFREMQDKLGQNESNNKIEYRKTDDEIINRKPKSKVAQYSADMYKDWTVESMIPANASRTATTLILRSGNETIVETVQKPMNQLIGSEVELEINNKKRKIYIDPYKKY